MGFEVVILADECGNAFPDEGVRDPDSLLVEVAKLEDGCCNPLSNGGATEKDGLIAVAGALEFVFETGAPVMLGLGIGLEVMLAVAFWALEP